MSDERDDDLNGPLDRELDNAEMYAAELVASAKRVGLAEVALPVMDLTSVWAVSVKKLGIQDGDEPDRPLPDSK
jgi:hypothetical protein